MRDVYGELVEELELMTDIAKEEKRELTDEENSRATDIEKQLSDLETKIEFREKLEDRLNKKAESEADQRSDIRHKKTPESEKEKVVKRYSFLKAINARAKGKPLTGVEAEMHQEAEKEARSNNISLEGIGVPSMFFRDPSQKRDMTVLPATAGGATVQTNVQGLVDYLWPRTNVQALGATVISGLSSNVTFPKKNAVPVAEWEGETDDNAESNPTVDTFGLTPKRLGTFVDISKQLLLQSNVSGLDGIVRGDIESSIGQALEAAFLNGSGTGNIPEGIMNNSDVNVISLGTDGAVPDWAKIVEMEEKVADANADFGSMAYLTTPGMRGLMKTTEKAANTGMFIWENSPINGVTPTIGEGQVNGYRGAISTLVPSNLTKGTGTNLHAIIFGNFAQGIMGQFGGLDVVVDPYTQATKTLMRIVLNSWWDIALRHPKAFSVIKDAARS